MKAARAGREYQQARIQVGQEEQNANLAHYGFALGYTPQTEIAEITTHGYPGTALISYNFGWIDPTTVGPSMRRRMPASRALRISGCITSRSRRAARQILHFRRFRDRDQTPDRCDDRTGRSQLPAAGVWPQRVGFGVIWEGQIKPRYSETYTFKVIKDNGAKLTVNGGRDR
jgi:hypothetical protein